MAVFRKASTGSEEGQKTHRSSGSGSSDKDFKVRTANVHDPILSAVSEAQPFELAAESFSPNSKNNNRGSMQLLAQQGQMKDVFGNPISRPDISNPTRHRDERPLDTIRSFEYAITGDESYRDQLETPRLGWSLRNGNAQFPTMATNPYASNGGEQHAYQAQEVPVSTFNREDNTEKKKKKKKGFFSRKNKD